jgi:hypothetical protein
MRVLFVLSLIIFPLIIFSQEATNTSQLYRFLRNDAVIFDFSNRSQYSLVKKYFNFSSDKETLSEDIALNEALIKNVDFNLLSMNNELGMVHYIDTIFFKDGINFDDGNFLIKNIFNKNLSYVFNINKYGFYLNSIIIRDFYSSDLIIPISISIRLNCIIIKSRFRLNLNKDNYDVFSERFPYNDPNFSNDIKTSDYKPVISFNQNFAYHQLNTISKILESRELFKKLIIDGMNDIIKSKT